MFFVVISYVSLIGISSPYNYQNDDYVLKNCYFFELSSASSGAAICFLSSDRSIVVESSVFSKCTTHGSAGAIYVPYSCSVSLSKVCGYKCWARDYYCFSYITCGSYISESNLVSISSCPDRLYIDGYTLYYSTYFCGGQFDHSYMNSSFNEVGEFSIARINDVSQGNMGYCTFAHTYAQTCTAILYFYSKIHTTMTNFVNNTQNGVKYGGTLLCYSSPCYLTFSKTNFIRNHHILFSISSGWVLLQSCSSDINCITSYITISSITNSSITHKIDHLNTNECGIGDSYVKSHQMNNISSFIVLFSLLSMLSIQ